MGTGMAVFGWPRGGLPTSITDDFSADSGKWLDGDLASATITIDSARGIWTPTRGADLFDAGAGTFESGTYSWTASGSNTITNDAGQLKITFVDNAAGAVLTLGGASDLSTNLTVNTWYEYARQMRVDTGNSVDSRVFAGAGVYAPNNTITSTSLAPIATVYRALDTTGLTHLGSFGAGEIVWIDNQTFRALTFASMIRWQRIYYVSEISVKAWRTPATPKGIIIGKDANNFILAMLDGGSNVVLYKRVAGTWSAALGTGAITHSAGSAVKLTPTSTAFSAFTVSYGGSVKITSTAITDFAADVDGGGKFVTPYYVGMFNGYNVGDIDADAFDDFSAVKLSL